MKKMRYFGVIILLTFLLLSCGGSHSNPPMSSTNEAPVYKVQKTEVEWRDTLSRQQYYVLREAETEPRHSSPLVKVTDDGIMRCAACGNALFDNAYKYTTTSSWPSFDRVINGAVVYKAIIN